MLATLRAALARRLERIGRVAWSSDLPVSFRVWLIRAIFARTTWNGPLGSTMRIAAMGVAAGGADALASDPPGALEVIARLKRSGATPVLICGDSHSRLYIQCDRRAGRWLLPLHHLATGASARGLANPASRSGEGAALRALLAGVAAANGQLPVVLVFGQVDVEFVFVFKRLSQGPPAAHDPEAFDRFCSETAQAYVAYAAALPMPCALAAIFPPALSDAAWRQGYLNAHLVAAHAALDEVTLRQRLVAARIEDLPSRTAQHGLLNRRLRDAALAHGIALLDIVADLLGADGVVAPRFVGVGGGRDHHLDARAVQPKISQALWAMLDSLPQPAAHDRP